MEILMLTELGKGALIGVAFVCVVMAVRESL